MQENNNPNPEIIPSTDPVSTSATTVLPVAESKNNIDKKKIIIIAIVVVILAVLVIFYFVNKNKVPVEKIYTTEEKVEMIEDVARRIQDQGLPPVEKQIDIMNYNAQN